MSEFDNSIFMIKTEKMKTYCSLTNIVHLLQLFWIQIFPPLVFNLTGYSALGVDVLETSLLAVAYLHHHVVGYKLGQ